MQTDLAGFPRLGLPHPRVLYARSGSFEALQAVTLALSPADVIVTSVAAGAGPIEIQAGGLANPSTNAGASVDLVARTGGVILGQARLFTDLADAAAGLHSIAANTPCLFSLTLWRNAFRNAVSSVGVTMGGLVVLSGEAGADTSFARNIPNAGAAAGVLAQVANVHLGDLQIGFTSIAVAAVLFTLDWLRIVEYPEALP